MLDIKIIRENPEKVNELLKRRNPELSIDEVLKIDVDRRKIQTQADELRACHFPSHLALSVYVKYLMRKRKCEHILSHVDEVFALF